MKIFDDAGVAPSLFCWFGEIPIQQLRDWLEQTGLTLPSDLVAFWSRSGGGDIFESETILRPPVRERPTSYFCMGDDTETVNAMHRSRGMPPVVFLFHVGAFLSAVSLSTQTFVTLRDDYTTNSEFASLDDWYRRTVRAEFAERYGLPAA